MVSSASKYAIISLTVGQVLVGRNRVKAIKEEFQRLVGENTADLVVIDYQGESLVRFIGGKVLKGQHYRKFSQRGTKPITPKPKPAPEVAAPAPVAEEPAPTLTYAERQEKWLADNKVEVGTKVRIVSIPARFQDGWENVTNDEMSRSLGKEMTVAAINTGLSANVGIRMSDGWYWPVFALEVIKPEPAPSVPYSHPANYSEKQANWVAVNNVKVGDMLTIEREPEYGLDGWNQSVGCAASTYVGRTLKVTRISDLGIELDYKYRWPFGVLKVGG